MCLQRPEAVRRHGLGASLFIAEIHVGCQTLGTVSLALPDFLVEGEALVTNAVDLCAYKHLFMEVDLV